MEELQVIVQQEPGVIRWNFEDLKAALTEELSVYKGMVYDDAAIQRAKEDVANLRKLKTAVEDKRKEIKKKCMEPYNALEKQAKELCAIIDEPISLISKQVDEYEEAQRKIRKDRIMKFMGETFSDLPEDIRKKAEFSTYDNRWENKTAKVSDWKAAIVAAHDQIQTALGVVAGVDEDFREEAMRIYKLNLSLPDAMAKVQELQRQREMILEQQRRREAEERDRREREAAMKAEMEREEQERLERERIRNEALASVAEKEPEQPVRPAAQSTAPDEGPRYAAAQPVKAAETVPFRTFRIYGTPEQVSKIIGYVRFVGAKAEEVH